MTEPTSTSGADLVRKHLFVHSEEIYEDLLVKLKPHIELTQDGVVTVRNLARLKMADGILLYLTGKRFFKETEPKATDTADAQEIASALGMNKKVCIARLNDLKRDGFVVTPQRGQYRAVLARVRDWVDSTFGER
jgi:hypothetical protein